MSILGAIAGSVVSGMFNQSNAREQMGFQGNMSNTSYQRGMADMKAAGLNPILAAKIGGASTPAGAAGTMPDMGATINNAINAGTNAQNANTNQSQMQSNVQKQGAEIGKLTADTAYVEKNTEMLFHKIKQIDAATSLSIGQQIKVAQETANLKLTAKNLMEQNTQLSFKNAWNAAFTKWIKATDGYVVLQKELGMSGSILQKVVQELGGFKINDKSFKSWVDQDMGSNSSNAKQLDNKPFKRKTGRYGRNK